jgi:hypothetical protein
MLSRLDLPSIIGNAVLTAQPNVTTSEAVRQVIALAAYYNGNCMASHADILRFVNGALVEHGHSVGSVGLAHALLAEEREMVVHGPFVGWKGVCLPYCSMNESLCLYEADYPAWALVETDAHAPDIIADMSSEVFRELLAAHGLLDVILAYDNTPEHGRSQSDDILDDIV